MSHFNSVGHDLLDRQIIVIEVQRARWRSFTRRVGRDSKLERLEGARERVGVFFAIGASSYQLVNQKKPASPSETCDALIQRLRDVVIDNSSNRLMPQRRSIQSRPCRLEELQGA